MALAPDFVKRIELTYGEAGAAWVARLPEVLAAAAAQWGVRIGAPFPGIAYNFVAPAVRDDGTEVVVKAGVPRPELHHEIVALRVYGGHGAVRLLGALPEHGAFLLEYVRPGTPIFDLDDDVRATAAMADVTRQLHAAQTRPDGPSWADDAFPTVAVWAEGVDRLRARFGGGSGPFPEALVAMAEGLFGELLPSQAAPVLLHGDLHHWNVVSAERAPWLAIDPQGVVGEPAYEVGAWLRNPFDELLRMADPVEITRRRLDQFADLLGFDRARMWGWGVAQAVLSACWDLEDGDPKWAQQWIRVAEVIEAAKPG